MPDGMIQKERKKRIIKQAAMKAILVIILVCIAMITFLLLFQVRKIEVSGNQYLSRQEIADWVQDDNWSSNSLYVMIRNHLMNHELLPAMEEANVTMKNPWTVKVTIKEKRVAGYIVSGDECIYFDKDGIVLAKTKELWDGTASRLLKRLEDEGLVQRSMGVRDARMKRITPTLRAQALNQEAERRIAATEATLTRGISQEEIDQFLAIAEKLKQNLI